MRPEVSLFSLLLLLLLLEHLQLALLPVLHPPLSHLHLQLACLLGRIPLLLPEASLACHVGDQHEAEKHEAPQWDPQEVGNRVLLQVSLLLLLQLQVKPFLLLQVLQGCLGLGDLLPEVVDVLLGMVFLQSGLIETLLELSPLPGHSMEILQNAIPFHIQSF